MLNLAIPLVLTLTTPGQSALTAQAVDPTQSTTAARQRRVGRGTVVFAQAQAPQESVPVNAPRPSMRLFRVQWANAEEIAQVLRDVVDRIDLAVDQRTNTLVISGSADHVEQVSEIVSQLDSREEHRVEADAVRTFRVQSSDAQKMIHDLMVLAQGRGARDVNVLRAQTDRDGSTIVASGPAAQMEVVSQLVATLDRPSDSHAGFLVQLHALIDGEADGGGGRTLDFPGAAAVRGELAAIGIHDPALLFRTMARVQPSARFEVTGTATRKRQVEIRGRIQGQDTASVTLDIEMTISEPEGNPSHIQTTVRLPLGDQVVIGAAPHEGATVVLVLRIESATRTRDVGSASDVSAPERRTR